MSDRRQHSAHTGSTSDTALQPDPFALEFADLYRRGYPIVWASARARLPCDADADGVAQDVFLRLWKAGSDTWPRANAPAFFRRAGRNEAVSRIRHRRRLTALTATIAEGLGSQSATPDEYAARAEARLIVGAAIRRLPPRCRTVVRLALLDGLTNAEIAKRLGIGVGAVEKQQARGRWLLASLLRSVPNLARGAGVHDYGRRGETGSVRHE